MDLHRPLVADLRLDIPGLTGFVCVACLQVLQLLCNIRIREELIVSDGMGRVSWLPAAVAAADPDVFLGDVLTGSKRQQLAQNLGGAEPTQGRASRQCGSARAPIVLASYLVGLPDPAWPMPAPGLGSISRALRQVDDSSLQFRGRNVQPHMRLISRFPAFEN